MAKLDLHTCLDIFDCYDNATFEYVNHILMTKIDGEERVKRAMPDLQKRARWLVNLYANTEEAYPVPLP